MTMVVARQRAEDEIRGLLSTWANATRAKDIDAIISNLAPDAVAFDCHGPLQFEGAGAYRKHLEACLPCMQGPMTLELRDLAVTTQGGVGFCHYLALCGGTGPDGTVHRSWFRGTACFRRIKGTWKIAHEHLSAPFDPQSGKTSLDLEPEPGSSRVFEMIPHAPALAGTKSLNVTEEQMALDMTKTDDRTQIRGLLDDWAKAVRASDIEGIMAAYAPDILSFDAIAQLQFKGAEAYRKHWEACLTMCVGPVIFEIHDLGIEAGDGIAFAHYLLRCGGTGPDGKQQVGWMRVTVCCRRTHGRWVVAHEHFSVPFDMESGKALLGLEPQDADETRAA